MRTWKTIWWFGLAAGIGGTLMFGALCIQFGPPSRRESIFYLWPLCTVGLSIIAALGLRRCYRLEPAQHGGLWQLSLRDLLVISFFAAFFLAAFKGTWPESFVYVGVPWALVSTALCVAGLLVAARKGIAGAARRYCFAAGFMLRLYGALGVGASLVIIVVVLVIDLGGVGEFCSKVFSTRPIDEAFLFYPIRAGFVCLLPGLLLCHLAQRKPSLEGEKSRT